jgi:transposase
MMNNYIIAGIDLHDNMMVVRVAKNTEKSVRLTYRNTRAGRGALVRDLKARASDAGEALIVAAYEASSQGFGLYDDLMECGIVCHVFAPTEMERSARAADSKNDDRDAEQILGILRAHLLAGNSLPSIWVPDKETRDDREIVRARLDAASKLTAIKAQVQTLLKRNSVREPADTLTRWTKKYRAWLAGLTGGATPLAFGARNVLKSLLRQLEFLEDEIERLDSLVETLSAMARYALTADELMKQKGVGLLTAMVFLTEMGDLSRFKNRKDVGSYLGLAPTCHESGEANDRKGHITHRGPHRVRKVLCQAVWARVRHDKKETERYDKQVARNPKHKKIAVVAAMRRLAVILWHKGLEAQQRAGVFQREAEALPCMS